MTKSARASDHQSTQQPQRGVRNGKFISPAALTPDAKGLAGALTNPEAASPANILRLQQSAGNRAIQRLLARRSVQAKLVVGPAGDSYEQEADRVAEQVMRAPVYPSPLSARGETGQKEEEAVQRKPLAASITPWIQRHSVPSKKTAEELKEEEEEKQVQRRPAPSHADTRDGFEAGSQFESKLAAAQGSGIGLPAPVRGEMESRFGADFGGVRLHADAAAGRLNREIDAQAFTHGSDIYFGAGKYDPGTRAGKSLLAHELTHVVQQSRTTLRRAGKKKKTYNVAAGEKLPETKEMAKERMKTVLGYDEPQILAQARPRFVTDAQTKIADDGFVTPIVQKALDRFKKTDPAGPIIQDLRDSFAKFVDPKQKLDDIIAKVKDDFKATKKDALVGVRIMIANDFKTESEKYSIEQAAKTAPGLRKERKYLRVGADHGGATEAFWQARQAVTMEDTVPQEEIPGFATALKQMPTVQFLLTPRKERKAVKLTGGWKDSGRLEDKIKPVNDLVAIKKWMGSRRTNSKTFRRRLNKVDEMVRLTVEPEFLAEVPKPTINIHATAAQGFLAPWGYRANAGQGQVNVAYDEATNVIAHEVGHILEEYLPMKRWHDIHLLLGARHRAAGGGETAVTGDMGSKSEGRYAGEYVTGKYTSTAYKGDNAEVVSMAMQFLAKPKDALKLIDGDPQHAAIILRGFRPQEYKITAALRKYDQYLPHKNKVAKPKEKTKDEQEAETAFQRVKAIFEQYQGFTFEQIMTLGEISGFDILKALSVKGEELDRRIQALVSANSGVTREDLAYYAD